MAIFTGDYKNNLDFEYGTFFPFYDKLKDLEKNDHRLNEREKIDKAIYNATDFFAKFTAEKNRLRQQEVRITDVLTESNTLIKKVSDPDDSVLQGIIEQDQNARKLVLFGERLGGYCAMSKLSSSQIRNAYGQVKKLELIVSNKVETEDMDALSQRKLMLIIPRLAYAARKGGAMVELSHVLIRSIKYVVKVGDFMRFSQFFEAILAYHKAYGGQ